MGSKMMSKLMSKLEQASGSLDRAVENPTVVNTFLGAIFVVMSARSWSQDGAVHELEAERNALLTTNKQTKNSIWEWKETLYAEAKADPEKALVPLSTLQSIYGDVVTPAPSSVEDDKDEGKPPKMTLMV